MLNLLHHCITTHSRGKEGSLKITKEERIIPTSTSNQDTTIIADIAIVLSNHNTRLKPEGKKCILSDGPKCGDGYDLSFNPTANTAQCCPKGSVWDGVLCSSQNNGGGCRPGWKPVGDRCKLEPRPAHCRPPTRLEDGQCVSDKIPTCPNGYTADQNNQCKSEQEPVCPDGMTLVNGQCVSTRPLECPPSTHPDNGRCVSNRKPACSNPKAKFDGKGHCFVDDMPHFPSGIYHDGACLTGQEPICSDPNTRYFQGRCVSSSRPECPPGSTMIANGDCITHVKPKCTEEGYEWSELEKQCRSKEKTECPDGYRAENGQCVSGDLPDCGEHGTLQGKDCFSRKEPKCSDDTYWDGEDCRSPDEPDCGEGKRFKKEKNTCVAVEEPVCDDTDTVFDKVLNKCVLVKGPQCPDGQKFNPATQGCVLLLVPTLHGSIHPTPPPNTPPTNSSKAAGPSYSTCLPQTRPYVSSITVQRTNGSLPRDEQGHVPDMPRSHPALTEPFMVTIRQLGEGVKGIKIIWWYIAALDGGVIAGSPGGEWEKEFTPEFFSLGEAVEKLSFEDDRAVLRKAIALEEAR
ncbi:hypothetical protein BDV32DRAFT_149709 [Aspergillus pseudonomiae]|nr:hypothetical protein BDV32DRAFT_149709 [Aspergillus pseudonomiae]